MNLAAEKMRMTSNILQIDNYNPFREFSLFFKLLPLETLKGWRRGKMIEMHNIFPFYVL